MFLNLYNEIFARDGDKIDIGCEERNIDKLIKYALSVSPNKRIRVVKKWHWLDVIFNDDDLEVVKSEELLPSLIYCENLVYDSRLIITIPGRHVRTSLLIKFHQKYNLFETKNTHYILIGTGQRKSVKAEFVFGSC